MEYIALTQGKHCLMDAITRYLEMRRTRISPNYLRDSGTVLRAWAANVDSIEDVTKESVQEWIDARNVKPATVSAYAFTLHQFFAWCISKKLIVVNPAEGLDIPKHRKPFRKNFISANTVQMLIAGCADQELKYCLFCGLHSGLRFSEVVASKAIWFNMEDRMLSILRSDDYDTKDHTDRDVPLTNEFVEFLKVYGMRQPYMIGQHKTKAAKHRYRFDFSCRFENYVRSKHVNMTFHDCRRTFASLHAQAGTSIYKIARWLGDDCQVVQKHYGFLSDKGDPEINRAFAA